MKVKIILHEKIIHSQTKHKTFSYTNLFIGNQIVMLHSEFTPCHMVQHNTTLKLYPYAFKWDLDKSLVCTYKLLITSLRF